MKSVALVTYSGRPELSPSDQTLLNPLKKRGIQVIPAIWNDTTIDWRQFDAVVLRSCWDYYKHAQAFRQWLTQLQDLSVPLYNTPKTVLWNMEKTYLRDLAQQGVKTIPTIWADKPINLSETMETRAWEQIVLKPAMGASGYGIHVVAIADAHEKQALLDAMLQQGQVLIQPVIEEIQNGELSLIFFQDEFQYAIRKIPGADTIFVNSAYGGSYTASNVDDDIVKVAQSVLTVAHEHTGQDTFLYTRVDGIVVETDFVLMELELIEPGLFMDIVSADVPERFADAIDAVIAEENKDSHDK
ncbi:MAG: hypothetical protein AAFV98_02055 [Chloroflexota bacterium]